MVAEPSGSLNRQNSGFMRVGDFGTGTLNVLDGGIVTNTSAIIANRTDSLGNATVSGRDSTWTSTLGSGTLSSGGNDLSTLFSGGIYRHRGFIKQGTGTQTFSGDSTYTSATTVEAGKFVVNGSILSARR